MKRTMLVLIFAVGLLLGMRLTFPATEAAAWRCPYPYEVKPGDTLSSIAVRAGVNVWHIARLNRLRNIDYLYAGQTLCLPGLISPPATPFNSSFDLRVEYKFDREADPSAKDWVLGRNQTAGQRLNYPLISGDSIATYSDTVQLKDDSIANESTLLFWLARTNPDADTYTLVVIGDPQPLLDLQMEMTRTQTISDIIPPPDPADIPGVDCPSTAQPISKLSVSGKNQVPLLQAELMAGNNIFIPVNIINIDYHQTVEYAKPCYQDKLGFALHHASGSYKLLMILTDSGTIGPPGNRWRQYCGSWGGGGWWSRWRYSWWGC